MIYRICIALLLCAFLQPAMTQSLSEHQWQDRVILVFSPDLTRNFYQQQMKLLKSDPLGLVDRDLVLYQIFENYAETPSAEQLLPNQILEFWNTYNPGKQPFLVVLIGKDGTEKLRSQRPISLEKLYSTIDAMPMRRREVRARGTDQKN